MTNSKQCKDVLGHLKSFRFITPKIARDQYAIERLAGVVFRLRIGYANNKKYNITTEIMSGLNRFKKPCTYARYRLVREPNFKLEA